MSIDERFVLPFASVSLDDVARVGGKNASLGEMLRELGSRGVRVPDGFAITAEAFRLHLQEAGLTEDIGRRLDALDVHDTRALSETAREIRRRVADAPLPAPVAAAIRAAYAAMSESGVAGGAHPADEHGGADVAVRSSATAEDLPDASFAGQQETFLHVRGNAGLDAAVRACMASLYTDRAIVYRVEHGFRHRDVALSVGVQRMVRSGRACAGTMFTLDPETGFRGVVVIDGAWGLGESVVQGRVTPDEWIVHKAGACAGFRSIIDRRIADKPRRLVPVVPEDSGGAPVPAGELAIREEAVPEADRRRPVLGDEEILALARWAVIIEEHASKRAGHDVPMDIEWAKDGPTGELFVVQARPETVRAREDANVFESFRVVGGDRPLVSGKAVGRRAATGKVAIVRSREDLADFPDGAILVAPMTDPDWEPVLQRAAAVVTDHGGRTCHAAIISREMGLPCVVGCGDATARLAAGRPVTVSCTEGEVGRVYEGELEIQRSHLDLSTLAASPVPLMLNLADPDRAFHLAALPAAGVGLLRTEFIVGSTIGVHPMALAHPERLTRAADRLAIEVRIREAGGDPLAPRAGAMFFVDRLAAGVARIAAAMFPRPVIVRFSDFKSNEYAHLLGGADFEESEENPMIGFRGASRYDDPRYRDGFALECEAIRRVRNDVGLDNVRVMIPFCRTLGEADRVLETMAEHGLPRGGNGLEVFVMCEIPSNVVLASEFAERFDGFSIGSNDLTQLTLGVDRDSELLQHLFDERDPAVRWMIATVIERAHAAGVPVGICGEAPSNHPDFARWLMELGIDSMSLNPDALPVVIEHLTQSVGG